MLHKTILKVLDRAPRAISLFGTFGLAGLAGLVDHRLFVLSWISFLSYIAYFRFFAAFIDPRMSMCRVRLPILFMSLAPLYVVPLSVGLLGHDLSEEFGFLGFLGYLGFFLLDKPSSSNAAVQRR